MKRFKLLSFIFFMMIMMSFFLGCFDGGSSPTGSSPGLTPGGAQDYDFIRSYIYNGGVPASENFEVEGLLSEYDLPLESVDTDREIAINYSYGYASEVEIPYGGMYVQMGFSSNINMATFERDPLNLCIVMDKSESMVTDSASPGYNKLVLVKEALYRLVDQLNEDDLLSIVVFNENTSVIREPEPVVEKSIIIDDIRSIYAEGRTNMDEGLRMGYSQVRQNSNSGRSNRVILLTDAIANTGNFTLENFSDIVIEGVEFNIGITSLGVGLNFNQELLDFISSTRGANYFFMNDINRVEQLFVEDFDYMVTPVAYDLTVSITPTTLFYLDRTFGFPSAVEGEVSMTVNTLFLSRNSGATLLHFDLPNNNPVSIQNGTPVANFTLTYMDRHFNQFQDDIEVVYEGPGINTPNVSYFDQETVRKTVMLAREVQIMQEACTLYHDENSPTAATELLNSLVTYMQGENEHLGSGFYSEEIALVNRLIANMD